MLDDTGGAFKGNLAVLRDWAPHPRPSRRAFPTAFPAAFPAAFPGCGAGGAALAVAGV